MKEWIINNWNNTMSFLIVIGTFIMAIATVSLVKTTRKAWKDEIIEKRVNELNLEAYNLIEKIDNELKIPEFPMEDVNGHFGSFFEDIEEQIKTLSQNLKRASQRTDYIDYFKNIVIEYSKKFFDDSVQDAIDYSELSPYTKDFWADYNLQTDKKLTSDLCLELDQNIKKAKKHYDDEIIKFYKK